MSHHWWQTWPLLFNLGFHKLQHSISIFSQVLSLHSKVPWQLFIQPLQEKITLKIIIQFRPLRKDFPYLTHHLSSLQLHIFPFPRFVKLFPRLIKVDQGWQFLVDLWLALEFRVRALDFETERGAWGWKWSQMTVGLGRWVVDVLTDDREPRVHVACGHVQ